MKHKRRISSFNSFFYKANAPHIELLSVHGRKLAQTHERLRGFYSCIIAAGLSRAINDNRIFVPTNMVLNIDLLVF